MVCKHGHSQGPVRSARATIWRAVLRCHQLLGMHCVRQQASQVSTPADPAALIHVYTFMAYISNQGAARIPLTAAESHCCNHSLNLGCLQGLLQHMPAPHDTHTHARTHARTDQSSRTGGHAVCRKLRTAALTTLLLQGQHLGLHFQTPQKTNLRALNPQRLLSPAAAAEPGLWPSLFRPQHQS